MSIFLNRKTFIPLLPEEMNYKTWLWCCLERIAYISLIWRELFVITSQCECPTLYKGFCDLEKILYMKASKVNSISYSQYALYKWKGSAKILTMIMSLWKLWVIQYFLFLLYIFPENAHELGNIFLIFVLPISFCSTGINLALGTARQALSTEIHSPCVFCCL